MEFRILGDIEVRDQDREIALGGPKQRALLAILLLRANETVSRDRLIDELWGERPPASAAHTLDSYVHRLRRALGAEGPRLLRTRGAGYHLQVAPGALDLDRFQRAAGEGARALETGAYERAANKLAAALAIWRGPALADLDHEPFARVELDRLEELRLAALEDRIDADLALGRHASTVAELRALIAEHPLRERLRSQLMLALYRCGRQADALDAYQEAREYMVGELGIEPARGLQDLHDAILRQDEALEPQTAGAAVLTTLDEPSPRPAEPGPTPPDEEAPASPGREVEHVAGARAWGPWAPIAGAGAAVALVAVGLAVAFGGDSGGGVDPAAVAPDSALLVDTAGRTLQHQIALGGRAVAVAADDNAVWVAGQSARELVKLDPVGGAVVDRIPLRDDPDSLAFAGGALWAGSASGGVVYEVDPEADRVVATVAVGNGPTAIAGGEGGLWVADAVDGTLRRIDPARARVTQTIETAEPLSAVATGLGGVWATSADDGVLIRIDPRTGRPLDSTPVGNEPVAVAVAGGAVWVSNPPDGTVTRVDPLSGELRKVTLDDPGALAAAGSSLWVAEPRGTGLTSIELATATVSGRIETGSPATAITALGGDLAAVTGPAPSAHRGGTLRVVGGETPETIDPGKAFSLAAFELLSLTDQGLITYAREPGPAGTEVLAGLAASVPRPTDGGRTYSFQLRPDLRYSTGDEIDPVDFRTALERQYESSRGLPYFRIPLLGARRCVASPPGCDLSRGVEVDGQSHTVTYHLTRPDPAFPFILALPFGAPVPAGSPPIDAGREPLPATGPYEIAAYAPGKRLELARNPNFAGAGAPGDGFVDRIVIRLGLDPAAQTKLVETGEADLALDSPPAGVVARLLRQDPLQTHAYVSPTDLAITLNTRRPPFDKLAARRAVNYAVDRATVVRMAGGRALARPSCQVLPAGSPGFAPYCPYTKGASARGAWHSPDLERARRLVARSGTAGTAVLVASHADDPLRSRVARYFAGLLNRLGYRARVRIYRDSGAYYEDLFSLSDKRPPAISAGTFAWLADYPAASAFFDPLFSCRAAAPAPDGATNASGLCDRGIDARIREGEAGEATSKAAAAPAWQALDRAITRRAPWVSLINPRSVDYVGRRVGDYQRSPEVGSLLDRVWVR